MNMSNWMPAEGASSSDGDTTMEAYDWRTQLQPDLRQLIVDKIADTLKSNAPSSRHEECMERAVNFERLNYITCTSQSEYIQETALMTMKRVTPSWVPTGSTAQTSNLNGGDQKAANGSVGDPTLEYGEWRAQLDADSRQILVNKITDTLKRCLPSSGHEELRDLAMWFEEKTYATATSQSDYLRKLSTKMLAIYSTQSRSAANSVNSRVALDLTAHTDDPNGGDWKEEVYQKIKSMKDRYLLDLDVIHHKAISKLLQHDSVRQQPENGLFEKLLKFTHMLECCMEFIQTPKHGILAIHKGKLDTYEKAITNVINFNRRNPELQVQELFPPHMQPLQQSEPTNSQLTHGQSNEDHMVYILNSMQPSSNLDPGQSSNMGFLQQVPISSLQLNTMSEPHVPDN